MPMIASLRSIDQLLNRFDELSQRHAQFIEHFEQNFTETDNPLRQVQRHDDEQRKTVEKILRAAEESDDDDEDERPKAMRDFHRSMKITRYLHRPPSYASNRLSSRSSTPTTTVSAPLPRTTRELISVEPRLSLSKTRWTNPVHRVPVTQDPPAPRRRYERSPITVFTIETINRLSKPRVYRHTSIKRVPPRSTFSSPSPTKRVVNPVKSQVSAKKARLIVNLPSRPLLQLTTPKTVALKFSMSAPRHSVPTKNIKPSSIAPHRVRQLIS